MPILDKMGSEPTNDKNSHETYRNNPNSNYTNL